MERQNDGRFILLWAVIYLYRYFIETNFSLCKSLRVTKFQCQIRVMKTFEKLKSLIEKQKIYYGTLMRGPTRTWAVFNFLYTKTY